MSNFATRDFLTILSGMIARLAGGQSQLTDFNVGSVVRSLLEAPAAEIEALYIEFVNGLLDAIPTAIYSGFSFTRLPATYASGQITFSKTIGHPGLVLIPKGTVVSVRDTGQSYATAEEASIAPDYDVANVRVVALSPGARGNTIAGSVNSVGTGIPGIDSVTNPAAIVSGRDEESDAERAVRFAGYIESIARGTPNAMRYAVGMAKIVDENGAITEYVSRIGIDEVAPGKVVLWVHGSGGPVSQELLDQIHLMIHGYMDRNEVPIPGYRSAGVQVVLRRMRQVPIDLTVQVTTKPGYAMNQNMVDDVVAAAGAYFATVQPGDVVAVSLLAAHLVRVQGVLSVNIYAPIANVAIPYDSIPIIGSVDIT